MRPASIVAQVPQECVIGVDIGGTNLVAGAVDAQLGVHHRIAPIGGSLELRALLDTITEAVGEVRDAVGGEVEAVGFGIPCLIDDERGLAASSVHLPIAGVAFAEVMAERIGLPAFVDNDANLALLAEHRHGAARGERVARDADARDRRRRGDPGRRRALPRRAGRGGRARPHGRRAGRAAVRARLPEPRLPRVAGLRHRARARGARRRGARAEQRPRPRARGRARDRAGRS